jgi:uncharacterized protein (DUF1778 family)
MKKNKGGRPPKTADKVKSEYLEVRLDPKEKAAFKDAADVAGLPLSSWVRERLRRTARRELEEAGRQIAFLDYEDT